MDSEWTYVGLTNQSGTSKKGSWWTRLRTKVRTHRWKAFAIAAAATFSTLSVAAGNAGELFSSVHDGCRFIRICSPAPPPVLIGSLSEVRIGAPDVTFQEAYEERAGGDAQKLPHGEWRGQFVTYRLEYQGTYKATCTLQWTLYDASTGHRLPEVIDIWETRHVDAFPDGGWTKEAGDIDVNVGVIWVPYLQPGTFVVELELLNPAGVLLDLERTEPFEVVETGNPT